MRHFYLIVFLLSLATTCRSPEKLVQKGDYDSAIDRSVKLILKGKADENDKVMLERAYTLANQQNQERIGLLKAEKRPENWEEIYHLFNALNFRQTTIQKVLPLDIKGENFEFRYIDYTSSILEAKSKAGAYYYEKGNSLMSNQNKESFREAYYDFIKAREYSGEAYADINKLINDARDLGTSRALIEINNRSRGILPRDFYDHVLNFSTINFESFWVEYITFCTRNDEGYDYYIDVVIQDIGVSPNDIQTKEYTKRETVQDGYTYKHDRNGNVLKDSLGNTIKIPKFRNLTCTVVEQIQKKSVTINGDVEFILAYPERLLLRVPIHATSYFEHTSGRAIGDMELLGPEELHIIDKLPIPFPDDLSMIFDCGGILRQAVYDAIYNNRGLIR